MMAVSATLKAAGAVPSPKPAKARSGFPAAGFWIGLIILTMTMRGVSLWEVENLAHGRIGDMVLLLVFALWFGGRCLLGKFAVVRNRLDLAVMVFLMFYILSMLWTENVEAGWFRVLKLLRNGALYVLLADYLSANFRTRYRRVAACILITGLLQSLAYIISMARHGGLAALAVMLQADSLQSNNPALNVVREETGAGLFLQGAASWLPLCMFLGFSIQSSIRSRLLALATWLLICLMGVLTLLSATRAAMGGLAVGLFIIFFFTAPELTMKKAIGGGIALLALLLGAWYFNLYSFIVGRMTIMFVQPDSALAARLELFTIALDRFVSSPLLGVGVASIFPDGLTAVHNVYLQVLGELGIIGEVIFLGVLWLWGSYLMSAEHFAFRDGDPWRKRVAVTMLGLSAFFFVYFLVGHDLSSGEPWIILGIISALHNGGRRGLSA